MSSLIRTDPLDLPRRRLVVLWFSFLTSLAGVTAYYWIFTGFSIWDDEGTLMLTVRQYLGGMKLYDQVRGYGPVYYFYNWILRTASGTPVTHDTVRMSSLIPWLITALVCAWIVLRLTRSLLLASAAHILTFLALSFFRNEPGHPQELCVLLIICLIASGMGAAMPRWRWLAMICVGAIPAALLLIKVNIGVFAVLAVALTILCHLPRTNFSRYLFDAVAAPCVILPFVLMKAHLNEPVAERYCLVVTVSTVSMLLVLLRSPRTVCLSTGDFWIATGSFTFVVSAVLFVLIEVQGISPHSILNSLVLVNLRISVSEGLWYRPVRLPWIWTPWILAGLGIALVFVRNGAQNERRKRQLLYLKLILGPLSSAGLLFFRQSLLGSVTPFSWLVLYSPTEESGSSQSFPRTLLCSVAGLQTLYAYPVAGSQIGFIQIPLIVVAIVCLGDFLLGRRSKQPALPSPIPRLLATMLLLCIPVSYLVIAGIQRRTYDSLTPLAFPGAKRIHLPEVQARDYHWLFRNIQANCDIFFGMPELPSLHIWTNSPPPAGLVADGWMLVYTDEDQAAISSELSMHPKACVFYNAQLVGFWNPSLQNMDALPLARYIHRSFKVVGSLDDFSFLVRNDRQISAILSP